VSKVKPASQVTGLENVFREDEVNEKDTLTQDQALSNAPRKYSGFFVVDQILEE
jgi:aspartyl/glutamyl-tRNA(Asn/Gln) amidotransferase C subunit